MKNFNTITATIAMITLLASCESPKQTLSNPNSRKEIISAIANDPAMSNEMMTAMMSVPNGNMMMHDNQNMKMMMSDRKMMADMMKNNPGMMQGMMSNMMDCAKADTSMMSEMCNSLMGNQQMMDMMKMKHGQGMNGQNMNMKNMNGMK